MAKRKRLVPKASGETVPTTHINFVHRHSKTFCHATVEVDRKAKSKRTQRKAKHKGRGFDL